MLQHWHQRTSKRHKDLVAIADQATITPAEWNSLRNDETAAEVVAELMIRIIDMRRDEAINLLEVQEFREMTAEKLGV
ncbi:hypothetical protein FOXG_17855 [Fusarium oxysporum f. sp. lycopersici 4287]|uniref:Uncharacterized protein n=2 Tax=Fusarium oxysporum TaxID=5507 RepID=A0A0J9U4S4_FUSO4|nr:hypothetical protein FOXG_17855 [Fusarium oxysporum f. sp. lycopersici 4287]EXK47729.1 hypothetical protein FOMG_00991 [Fusarium oxysporum f. sp. melonis 26406]KAJ9428990.1 hypothetical protein QL093DRAFT_2092197 [Fusarium oxysporum]KNA94123.1 hypothetical protein FOXG_17855 [Fusarium oxysporum f. sp. lycopersici 4287]